MSVATTKQRRHESEADIQRCCCDLLALDGWRRLRCETVSRREWGKGFGEPGMADDLFIRYRPRLIERHVGQKEVNDDPWKSMTEPLAEVIWIEWKAPGGKLAPGQLTWHLAERARGGMTLIAGRDFPRSVDGFLEWYRVSGLMRRAI